MLAVAKTRTSVYQCYNRARTQLAPRIEIMRIKFILHEVFGHLLGVREYWSHAFIVYIPDPLQGILPAFIDIMGRKIDKAEDLKDKPSGGILN